MSCAYVYTCERQPIAPMDFRQPAPSLRALLHDTLALSLTRTPQNPQNTHTHAHVQDLPGLPSSLWRRLQDTDAANAHAKKVEADHVPQPEAF